MKSAVRGTKRVSVTAINGKVPDSVEFPKPEEDWGG